jgi:hypothetical protein
VAVTDRFRAEMNAWLLEMFGETTPFYVVQHGRIVAAHPNNIALLRRQLNDQQYPLD